MVNFGWNSASLLGVFLAIAGAGLYFLRSVRPELSRDYDIFFSAVGLVCGGILMFYGWRFDPIMQLSQFLLATATFFFAFETLRLRGLATEQARRSTPIVDDDRPVSRSYRAYREPDYDEIEPYRDEDYTPRKRLRGSDDYEEEEAPPPRSRSQRPTLEKPEPRAGRRPNRPAPRAYPPEPVRDVDDAWEDEWETETRSSRRPSRRPPEPPPERDRSRRTAPRSTAALYEDEEPAPYVDYVDYEEEDFGPEPRGRAPQPEDYEDQDYGPEAQGQPDFDDEPMNGPPPRRKPRYPEDDVDAPSRPGEY
ncbi:MAG: hypothetical protein EA366_13785 [Spirulina sp. DLM2.Bin59]|nr:MAG: hypothetical protein EA366_13785 [Spirulina sp. DLM2.Bin59]